MRNRHIWLTLPLVLLLVLLPPVAAQDGGSQAVITPENVAQLTQIAVLGYGEISEMAYSPDGTLLAVSSTTGVRILDSTTLVARYHFDLPADSEKHLRWGGSQLFIGTSTGTIFVWQPNAATLATVVDYSTSGGLMDFAPAADGSKLAVKVDLFSIAVYDARSAGSSPFFTAPNSAHISAFAWSPDSSVLAIGTDDEMLYLNGEPVVTELARPVEKFLWSPDGTQLAAILAPQRSGTPIIFFDPATQTIAHEDSLPRRTPANLAGWVNGKLLYSDGSNTITDYFSGDVITLSEPALTAFDQMTYSADGTGIAALEGAKSGLIKVYNLTTGALLGIIGGMRPIETVMWQGDQAIYGHLSPLYLWPEMVVWEAGHETYTSFTETGYAVLSPTLEKVALIGSTTGVTPIRILDLTTYTELEIGSTVGYGIAWSADGRWLFVPRPLEGGGGETLEIVDATNGQTVKALTGTISRATNVIWSPDGTRVAAADVYELNTIIWDTTTGEVVADLPAALLMGWSLDGQYMAIQQATLAIWSVANLEPVTDFGVSAKSVGKPLLARPVWSPDGLLFAFVTTENELLVWDSGTGAVSSLGGAQDFGLAWSPDGRLLAGFDSLGALTLWDRSSGTVLHSIPESDDYSFTTLTFSSDGTLLAAGTMEGGVLVFGVQ
ncbi:MAG: WD40 repeat domain-containing protein [Chloroflexi bacterium]|nr:WD40 repeat domain-containing protein [Chloroflexota bacterium]